MALLEVTEEFKSQMTFLKVYSRTHEEINQELHAVDREIDELKPTVNKYQDLIERKKELIKRLNSEEKFLIEMNKAILRNTGNNIDDGPLFDKTKEESE